ncbi:MAG: hypothetical protein SF029_18475 [bacterium]|nr:hypothetical protein [bacterium]
MAAKALARPSRISILVILVLLLCLTQSSLVQAARRDSLRWQVGCNGFTNVAGGVIFTRDNTGDGRESFTITAVDGDGNIIFGPVTEAVFVDSRLYLERGLTFDYEVEPTANPILVSLVSNEGNGAPAQVVYSAIGNCPGLPNPVTEINESVFELLAFVIDPQPSPSVPLNSDPPRPVNPQGISRGAGPEDQFVLVSNPGTVNLRSGDGPQYTVVALVEAGDELIVLGTNLDRSWWFVQVGEVQGWINAELANIVRGDLTYLPVIPVEGEIFLPRFIPFLDQNLLASPNGRSSTLCTIAGDLEYFVIGQDIDGEFFEIQGICGGELVIGWVPQDSGGLRNSGDLPIPVTDN